MPGTKISRRSLLVPAFLGGQALLVRWASGEERRPPMPDLSSFPEKLDDWRKVGDDPILPEVRDQLHADRLLSRTYVQADTGLLGNIFVAWFQSQRGGLSQPHSPQVCLPANGWVTLASGAIALETEAGTIPANQYLISQQGQRGVAIYWYQTPRRVIAGEWEAKFWILPDSLRDRRTDTSLVRLFVWNGTRTDSEIIEATKNIARKTYPRLREIFPR